MGQVGAGHGRTTLSDGKLALSQLQLQGALLDMKQLHRAGRVAVRVKLLVRVQLPMPQLYHVRSPGAGQQAGRAAERALPQGGNGLRLDQVHRRGTGYVDDIGNRYPERGGQLAQDGNTGIGRSLFDFDQHPLAHPGPARQLIERQPALLSVLLEPAGDGGSDMPHIGAGIGRYIDSLGHRSLS